MVAGSDCEYRTYMERKVLSSEPIRASRSPNCGMPDRQPSVLFRTCLLPWLPSSQIRANKGKGHKLTFSKHKGKRSVDHNQPQPERPVLPRVAGQVLCAPEDAHKDGLGGQMDKDDGRSEQAGDGEAVADAFHQDTGGSEGLFV